MQATTILAIVGIVSALGVAPSLIHIQQASAFLLGQGPPSNLPHSPLGILRGDLGILKGNLGALRGELGRECVPDCGPYFFLKIVV